MKHLDTFVQYKPRHTIIFMEVLEVTDTIDTKEICNVSWYMVCKDEIIIQSDFPMCATDGEFVNFVPIPRHSFLEARRLIKKIRKEQMFVPKNDKTAPSEFKQAYRKARRKISKKKNNPNHKESAIAFVETLSDAVLGYLSILIFLSFFFRCFRRKTVLL